MSEYTQGFKPRIDRGFTDAGLTSQHRLEDMPDGFGQFDEEESDKPARRNRTRKSKVDAMLQFWESEKASGKKVFSTLWGADGASLINLMRQIKAKSNGEWFIRSRRITEEYYKLYFVHESEAENFKYKHRFRNPKLKPIIAEIEKQYKESTSDSFSMKVNMSGVSIGGIRGKIPISLKAYFRKLSGKNYQITFKKIEHGKKMD